MHCSYNFIDPRVKQFELNRHVVSVIPQMALQRRFPNLPKAFWNLTETVRNATSSGLVILRAVKPFTSQRSNSDFRGGLNQSVLIEVG